MNILDKEEFRVKLGQINKLVETQDYKGAMQIVDSIDWRRVKNVRTLCVVGEIYAANKRYEESKEIFLLAYHRAPIGKNILYRLIEVSLKMGQISEATEFFDEYREVAGNDNSQYILKYKIARAKNASLNEQIRILEEYKEKEFTERWSYELAKLYYKAGDKQKCLDLCNEMILWFNDGTYVMKALDLKQRMGVLTGEEKEKYEQRFIPKLIPPEKAQEIRESKEASGEYEEAKPVTDTIQVDDERDLNSAETFQEKLSKGFRDIFGGHKKSAEEDMEEKEAAQDEEQDEVSTGSEDVTEQAEAPEAETAAAAEPSEEFTDSEEIEAAEGSEEASDEPSEEQEEFSGQEADEIPLASGVENLSSGSMKLQAQEQQDKEEEEAYQEAEEAEAEKATEMSLSQSVAEIMKEKAAGNEESEEKPAGVPLNEEGKPDFSATIRMPELKIPKSMINVDPENASSSAEIPDASGIFGSIDYKDKKDAVAVSDKVYNDIEELKKATTPDPKTGKSEIGLYDLIWFEDTTDNNRRVLCKPMDLFGYHYGSMNQALLAYENGEITLHQNIYVYRKATMADGTEVSGFIKTTLGLLIFNEIIPQDLGFVDRSIPENALKLEIDFHVGKKQIKQILEKVINIHGATKTAEVLDDVKAMGYGYSTRAAMTV